MIKGHDIINMLKKEISEQITYGLAYLPCGVFIHIPLLH